MFTIILALASRISGEKSVMGLIGGTLFCDVLVALYILYGYLMLQSS